ENVKRNKSLEAKDEKTKGVLEERFVRCSNILEATDDVRTEENLGEEYQSIQAFRTGYGVGLVPYPLPQVLSSKASCLTGIL
ncbi:Hypothetical predicted protein, partial [Marmota monax]